MSYFSVDVEADGSVPGLNGSMVCFGAVLVDDKLDKTFYGKTRPIIKIYDPEALAISGFTHEEHLLFPDPLDTIHDFYEWVMANSKGQPMMITDNPMFDGAYMNYYMHAFVGKNPFSYSARRIGDIYCGMMKDAKAPWKRKLRKTKHTHHPVDDAKGNAEAFLAMIDMGFKVTL